MKAQPASPHKPFPHAPEAQFKCLLSHAIFAPSGHNTQPWLFRLKADRLDLIADRTRALPVVDPCDRELTISCGAILDHLVVAARHYGYEPDVITCPDALDADWLASLRLGDDVAPCLSDHQLFEAISHRHTTRTNFDNRRLPDELSNHCVELAKRFGIELTLITDGAQRVRIADLVAEGDLIQFAAPHFRRELASWVHSRRSSRHDGMSGSGFGMPDVLSPVGAFFIRTFDIGKIVAAGDTEKIIEGSSTLAVFSTEADTVLDWLSTGRALSEVLLTLTAAGATASYINPPIEVEALRPRLQSIVGCKGRPQLLMRFGYGSSVAQTVRRDVREVLLS